MHEVAHKAVERAVEAVQDQLSPDTDRIKLREDAHGQADDTATEAIEGSLFEPTPNVDADNPYGTQGARCRATRRSTAASG